MGVKTESVIYPDRGRLYRWHVRPGDQVERGQSLATLISSAAQKSLLSPVAGVVYRLVVEDAATFAGGVPLCYIQPYLVDQRDQIERVQPQATDKQAPKLARRSVAAVAVSRRSSGSLAVEELRISRMKTERYTVWVADKQKEDVQRLALELKLAGNDYSQAELARTALRWLLGLSRQELLTHLRDNRKYEQEHEFGSGVPRP